MRIESKFLLPTTQSQSVAHLVFIPMYFILQNTTLNKLQKYVGKSLIFKFLSFKSLKTHDNHINIAKFLFNFNSLTSFFFNF